MTDHDLSDELARYQRLVAEYEALDREIDAFLAARNGGLDKMEGEEKRRYREMSRQRDELINERRALEQILFDGEED